MRALYISALSSKRLIETLFKKNGRNPGYAVQKFSRMIVNGLKKNEVSVSTLSVAPVATSDKIPFVFEKKELENSIRYNYVPFFNVPLLKHIMVFLYSVVFIFGWSLFDKKNKFFVCDGLNITLNLASLIVSKIRGMQNVCILTDMPGLMVSGTETRNLLTKFIVAINKMYLGMFSHYVFLTEAMNDVVNKNHRPYIVMEGLVDPENVVEKNEIKNKNKEKVVLYAGGLFEQYGLDTLVQAFMKLPMENARLVLFGSGSYVKRIEECAKMDCRIVYKGVRPNSEIVAEEVSATLLVNPRPTTEKFTKYSFPSKNMEYMASGTPLLTTRLPGMPQEYCPYVYIFDDESVEGLKNALLLLLSKPIEELHQKGESARIFVLNKKNNVQQAGKLVKLVCRNNNQ